MEEGDVSAERGGRSHSESASLVRENLAEQLLDDHAVEEALYAGDEAEYEAAFQRPGDEIALAETDEPVFVPHWTQAARSSSTKSGFPDYGSHALDDSYSHEARALIDAHDAAEERRAAALRADPEPVKADPVKTAAIFGRIYGEIFGNVEGRVDAAELDTAGFHEPVIEDDVPPAAGPAPAIEAPPGYSLGGHRPGGHGVTRGAFRDISDYDASGFGSMEEFDDLPAQEAQPIAFRGLRWIRRNVGNLKVTVSLQRGTPPPHPAPDRKPPA
jgi:hypothetical protein